MPIVFDRAGAEWMALCALVISRRSFPWQFACRGLVVLQCSQCAVLDSLLMCACFHDRCHVYRACVRCAAWDRCIFEFQVCARESGLSLIPRVICRVRRCCREFAPKGRRHVRACLSATLFSKCQACVLLFERRTPGWTVLIRVLQHTRRRPEKYEVIACVFALPLPLLF